MVDRIIRLAKENKAYVFLLALGFAFQMLIVIPSGSRYCFENSCGVYIWNVHVHDMVWHVSLAQTAFSSYPFLHPVYAGATLSGYNFLFDFLVFILSYSGLQPITLFFKVAPIVWFVLVSLSIHRLTNAMKKDRIFEWFLFFFTFFAGSLGYLFTLYHNQTFKLSGGLFAMQSGNMMTNLQLAFSFIVLFETLIIIQEKNYSYIRTLLVGILIFIGFGLKFYGGVITLFISVLYVLGRLKIKDRRVYSTTIHLIILSVCAVASIILFYNPFSAVKTGSIFIFAPFAIVHSIIEEPYLFHLPDMVNARYFLYEQSGWGPRLLMIELISVVLFLLFNFGTRVFGFMHLAYKGIRKSVSRFDLIILAGCAFSVMLSILFIQKGVWWNSIQFFYYALFLSNIFIAEFCSELFKKHAKKGIVIIAFILLLTIPENIDFVYSYTVVPPSKVSDTELEALDFLSKQEKGIVFNSFYLQDPKGESFEDTAYVSAFSGQQLYLQDSHVLTITGVDYEKRKSEVKNMNCQVLQEVEYIYYKKIYSPKFLKKCMGQDFRKQFENEEVEIYMRT